MPDQMPASDRVAIPVPSPRKTPGGNELLNPDWILREAIGLGFGMKVADLGCGSAAYFTLQAARIVGPRGVVYAVDILKQVLANVEAKAHLEGLHNIKPIWSNLEQVGASKIPEGELDWAFLINVLFQNVQHEAMISEAVRLLRPTGKLLVIDWKPVTNPLGPPVDKRLPPERIKQAAGHVGLVFESEFTAGPYHYGLVFKKA